MSEMLVAYFGLIGLLTIAVIFRPSCALAGVLCLFAIKQWGMSESQFLVINRTIPNFAVSAILLLGLILTLLRHRLTFGKYPLVGWLSLALYAYAAASYAWTESEFGYEWQWGLWWPYVITFVLLAPLVVVEPKDLYDAMVATLGVALFLMPILLFLVAWKGRNISYEEWKFIGGSKLGHGNPLATAQMAAYAMIIAVLVHFRRAGLLGLLVRWTVVILALAVIIRSGSRGPLFAGLLALLVFIPMSRRMKDVKGFLGAGISLILLLGIAAWVYDNFAEGYRWTADKVLIDLQYGRIAAAERLLESWLDHGLGAWVFGMGSSASFNAMVGYGFYVEVVSAEILAELGLVGFAMWAAIIFLTFRTLKRTYPLVAEMRVERGVLSASGAMFLFNLIIGFKGGSLLTECITLTFAIVVGRYALALRKAAAVAKEQEVPVEERLPLPGELLDYEPQPYAGVGYARGYAG